MQTHSLVSIDGSRAAELHGAGSAGAPLTERLGSSYAKLKEHVLKADLAMVHDNIAKSLSWTGGDLSVGCVRSRGRISCAHILKLCVCLRLRARADATPCAGKVARDQSPPLSSSAGIADDTTPHQIHEQQCARNPFSQDQSPPHRPRPPSDTAAVRCEGEVEEGVMELVDARTAFRTNAHAGHDEIAQEGREESGGQTGGDDKICEQQDMILSARTSLFDDLGVFPQERGGGQ